MHRLFVKHFPWILLALITFSLLYIFLFKIPIQLGGDIIDYFGPTETLLQHKTLFLTPETRESLSEILNPGYFKDYYNIAGRNGELYPVHFIFYSLILLPFRIILKTLHLQELRVFYVVNIFLFMSAITVIWKKYIKINKNRLIFLSLALFSSLMSFFKWPGPDLFYLLLLTIGSLAFLNQEYLLATLLVSVASWHSQPLIVLASIMLITYLRTRKINFKSILSSLMVVILLIVPYLYNYWIFGLFTPWSAIPDGWTQLRGFGLHNLSLFKLYEQFFDLNFGLFWYVPLFIFGGIFRITQEALISKKHHSLFLLMAFIVTAFFYQTNPAWHYGTAGYGPSRHVIFMLPIFLVLTFKFLTGLPNKMWTTGLLLLTIVTNLAVLKTNNYLAPNLEKTHYHNYAASYVLNTAPELYNPTPEIFADRTNHLEKDRPTTAIYKLDGQCKKAYVLISDKEEVEEMCGLAPIQQQSLDGFYVNY